MEAANEPRAKCAHEFEIFSWRIEIKSQHATSMICKKCLLILDNEDLIGLQNSRSNLRAAAKAKAEKMKAEMEK